MAVTLEIVKTAFTSNRVINSFLSHKINPDVLVKDELLFELEILGLDRSEMQSQTVDCLRTLFRQKIADLTERRQVSYETLRSHSTIKEISSRILYLLEELESMSELTRKEIVKLESKTLHFISVIEQSLKAFPTITPDKQGKSLTLLYEMINMLPSIIARTVDLQSKQVKSRPPSPANMKSPSAFSFPSTSNVVVSNQPGTSKLLNIPSVNIINSPTGEVNAAAGPDNNIILSQNQNQVQHSMYSKIHNPIESLTKNLKPTDGLNIHDLLSFLTIALKIQSFSQIDDGQMLKLLVPFTVGPLCDKITMAINSSHSFDKFHQEVLNYFVPQRLMSTIVKDRFYRLQAPVEPISAYVVSIKESALLLRLEKSEAEVVSTILSGLSPHERSRLIFMNKPTTLAQLDEICIQAQNLHFADIERDAFYRTNRIITIHLNLKRDP
ncbi:uncharacterized protein LOC120349650 [Nilaparvata lugens]|uniref:uncharacterized protein LOC120349650 n=1 Tax=Nilaparvata lugens TaxID=108931 RepID=UPI00193DFCCD|nr:uncharacterized protein LOC120349650 [Nilaparvata lugens]